MQTNTEPATGQIDKPAGAAPELPAQPGLSETRWQRLQRFFVGDDVFISYARRDAESYALNLAIALTKRRVSCYVDQWGSATGRELPLKLRLAVRRSTMLVLLGSDEAVRSGAVKEEVDEFLATGRFIIPVTFGGSLERAPWYADIEGPTLFREVKPALASGEPSPRLVERIVHAEGFVTRNRRLRRFVWQAAAAVGALVLAGAAVFYVLTRQAAAARSERDRQGKIASNIGLSNTAESLRTQRPDLLELSTLLEIESVRRFGPLGAEPPLSARLTLSGQMAALATHVSTMRHEEGARAVASTRDARYVAVATSGDPEGEVGEGRITLWECGPGGCRPTGHVYRQPGGISAVAFSPDGRYLAAATDNGLRVWEWQQPGDAPVLSFGDSHEELGSLADVAFSADGRYMGASGGPAGKGRVANAYVWKWEGERTAARPVRTFAHSTEERGHEAPVAAIDFSSDGEFLFTASYNTVRAWPTGGRGSEPVWRVAPGENDVHALAFSPDGRYVASGDQAGVARVWRWEGGKTGQQVFTYMSHGGGDLSSRAFDRSISSLAFSEDGRFLATASVGNTAQVWECGPTPNREVARVVHRGKVLGAALAGSGRRYLLTASDDKTARLSEWRESQAVVATMQPGRDPDKGFDASPLSPDGSHLAVITNDEEPGTAVNVWDTDTGRSPDNPPRLRHDYYISDGALSPDGKYLVAPRAPKPPQAWDLSAGRVVWQPEREPWSSGPDIPIFSPDGKYLSFIYREADASSDRLAVFGWESGRAAGRPLRDMNLASEEDKDVLATALSWGGEYLAAARVGVAGVVEIEVWSTATGQRVGAASRYATADKALGASTQPDKRGLLAVAFSPDGEHLAVASVGTAEVLKFDKSGGLGEVVMRFSDPQNFFAVAFSADGKYLRTGTSSATSADMSVQSRLWRRDDMVAELCGRLSRNLTRAEWRQHFGEEPYRRTCENLPAAEE